MKIPFYTERKNQKQAEKTEAVVNLTKTLEDPDNSLVIEFQNKLFSKVLAESDLDNIDEDKLTKELLSEILKDHILNQFKHDEEEAFQAIMENDNRFQKNSNNKWETQNLNPNEEVENLDEYIQVILKTEYIDSEGKSQPISNHPNFRAGNSPHQRQQIDLDNLYKPSALNKDESKLLLELLLDHIPDGTTYKNPHQRGSNVKVNNYESLKGYLNLSQEPEFTDRRSITVLKNSRKLTQFFENLLNEYNNDSSKYNDQESKSIQKFRNILKESLDPSFAKSIYNRISSTSIHDSLESMTKDTIGEFSEHDRALLLTSKEDMKSFFHLSNTEFDSRYKLLKQSIQDLYHSDKSKEVSYLYEQFFTYENEKIKGVTYFQDPASIQGSTQSKIENILTVKQEAQDLGIDPSRFNDLQDKAKKYPEALRKNFKEKLYKSRDKKKMVELRESRLSLAKLRAYNAALDLEITNEELSTSEAAQKIKEEVFLKAISTDLDDLFQVYQSNPEKNKIRKGFNKVSKHIDRKLAFGGALLSFPITIAGRSMIKSASFMAGGPLAAAGMGALMLKPAIRRGLNRWRPNVDEQEKEYDQISLNFSEATRDMTGNKNDSIFSKTETIENEYIQKQQETLQEFKKNISDKVDQAISNDKSLTSKQELLKIYIESNKNPKRINELAVEIQKVITKKITEIYIQEYKKVLTQIEHKRDDYTKRLLVETGIAIAATAGVSHITGLFTPENYDFWPFTSEAEAAEASVAEVETTDTTGTDTGTDADSSTVQKTDATSDQNSKNPFEVKVGDEPSPDSDQTNKLAEDKISQPSLGESLKNLFDIKLDPVEAAMNPVPEGGVELRVPTDIELMGTSDKDPGLVQLIRSWTDNKISVKDALEAAKQLDLENVHKIHDGQRIIFDKELVNEIAAKANLKPEDLAKRDFLDQYIKYFKYNKSA